MANVGIRHDQRMAANSGYSAALACTTINGGVFADHVMAANFQAGLFTLETQILGLSANRTKRKEAVMRANLCRPVNHHVRHQLTMLTQFHVRTQHAVRPNGATGINPCSGINNCCGMDHSVSVGASDPNFPRLIDTSCALTMASQTTLPFTKAFPSIRTMLREEVVLQLSISTSIRS